jgi:hypothetical protein
MKGGEIPPTFRSTAFKNGTHSTVHSAGPRSKRGPIPPFIPWDRLSALSLLLLLRRRVCRCCHLRCERRELLDVQNGAVGCVCVFCFG